jgi:periplasmic divalent cation tolerance protein
VDNSKEYSIVLTTCGSQQDAQLIITALITARLAPCVQTMTINSTYIWKGDVQNEDEVLLLIKSKTTDFDEIKQTILKLHPYEIPEIVQIPITGGFDRYLSWIDDPYA